MKAFVFLSTCLLCLSAAAHPADVTQLRVVVERQRLELRFTFTLYTLARLLPLDADGDQKLSREELELARPAMAALLEKQALLRLNDQATSLGTITNLEPLWPTSEAVAMAEADRVVDVVFEVTCAEVIANTRLEFPLLSLLGPLASIEATFEQGTLRMQVPFSLSRPHYLYDTGFAVEAIFQSPPSPPPSFWQSWLQWWGW